MFFVCVCVFVYAAVAFCNPNIRYIYFNYLNCDCVAAMQMNVNNTNIANNSVWKESPSGKNVDRAIKWCKKCLQRVKLSLVAKTAENISPKIVQNAFKIGHNKSFDLLAVFVLLKNHSNHNLYVSFSNRT